MSESHECPDCGEGLRKGPRVRNTLSGKEQEWQCVHCRCTHWEVVQAVIYCPDCDCNDVRELRHVKGWRGELIEYGCGYCGKLFREPYVKPVEEAKTPSEVEVDRKVIDFVQPLEGGAQCPCCGKFPVPVTSSRKKTGRIRYRQHKCPDCGWTGQSKEKVA